MRKYISIILLLLLTLPAGAYSSEINILFVGNSQISAHGMPFIFKDLALAGGHDVHVDVSSVGGSSLSYHTHHQPTLDKIEERRWDHVMLQEHSLVPLINYYVESLFYPSVAKLDSMISSQGSQATLFQHWARPNPSGQYCIADSCSREFEDYFDMQAEMSAPYFPLAAALNLPLLRVGDTWAEVLAQEPGLPLWGSDELHTSPEGAYFVACIVFGFVFESSPVGLDYFSDLEESVARHYQELAAQYISSVEGQVPALTVSAVTSHPNPFNPSTEINFEISRPVRVHLDIFDAGGKRVRSLIPGQDLQAGGHRVLWDGRGDSGNSLATGIYLVNLQAGKQHRLSKLTLLK